MNKLKKLSFILLIINIIMIIMSTSAYAAGRTWTANVTLSTIDSLVHYIKAGNTPYFCGQKDGFLPNAKFKITQGDTYEETDNWISYIFSYFDSSVMNNRSNYSYLQRILWSSGGNLNVGTTDDYEFIRSGSTEEKWKAEGVKFEQYINAYKSGGFQYKDNTKYDKLKQDVHGEGEEYFDIYDFNINYSYERIDSTLSGKGYELLSGIDQLTVYDQNGREITNAQLISSGNISERSEGYEISNDSEYPFPKSGENFKVRIPRAGNEYVTGISLKVHFDYVTGTSATFTEYSLSLAEKITKKRRRI